MMYRTCSRPQRSTVQSWRSNGKPLWEKYRQGGNICFETSNKRMKLTPYFWRRYATHYHNITTSQITRNRYLLYSAFILKSSDLPTKRNNVGSEHLCQCIFSHFKICSHVSSFVTLWAKTILSIVPGASNSWGLNKLQKSTPKNYITKARLISFCLSFS